jgi:ABC-type uncharacterized transport system substrate-binding protein
MKILARMLLGALAAAGLAAPRPAAANPYVWVTVSGTITYNAVGVPTAIRYGWRFDKSFSGFAAKGVDTGGDGETSPAELAAAAELNMKALAQFGYFTHVSAGGRPVAVGIARDYVLDHDGGAMTLRFTLPLLHAPASEIDPLTVKLYDPSYFVAFAPAPGRAIKLAGAPPSCAVTLTRPHPSKPGDLATGLDLRDDQGIKHAAAATVVCDAQALAFAAPTPPAAVFPPVSHRPPRPAADHAAPSRATPPAARAAPVTPSSPPSQPASAESVADRIATALALTSKHPADAPAATAPRPVQTAEAIRVPTAVPVKAETVAAAAPQQPPPAQAARGFSIRTGELLAGLGILGFGAALLGTLFFRGSVMR